MGNTVTFRGTNTLLYSTTRMDFKNDTYILFEIPERGFTQAPIQCDHREFTVSNGVTVELDAQKFGRRGGGRVVLAEALSANGNGIDDLYAKTSFLTGGGSIFVEKEEDGDQNLRSVRLVAKVNNEGATRILVR